MITWIICAAIVCWSGYFKYKQKMRFWPSKGDWLFFVIGTGILGWIEVALGVVPATWIVWPACFFSLCVIALLSSCIAWAIGKFREVLSRYSQVCPQCDSKEVVNEEFTDIFDYGCDNGCQARLAVESVKHICCNCGFEYTGYQNEEDRAKAVKNLLNR